MSSDSDRPIEKHLRAFAGRRRDAAAEDDFKIHPITRNSLKVEIVKQYGRRIPGLRQERSLWSAWWPRLAMAGGGLFVLLVAFLIVRPEPRTPANGDVAMSDVKPNPVPEPAQTETDAAIPTKPAPALTARQTQSMRAATPRPAGQVYQFYALAAPSATSDSIAASAPTAEATAPPLNSTAIQTSFSGTGNPSPARSLRPAPVEAPPRTASPANNLLESFQLRIDGDRVVVTDLDQSVYSGRIQPMDPQLLKGTSSTMGPRPPGDSTDPNFPTNYRLYSEQGSMAGGPAAGQFTVTGTNQTSGRQVEFSGQMLTWTQTVSTSANAKTDTPASIVRIRGTATIGGQPSILIDASTAPR